MYIELIDADIPGPLIIEAHGPLAVLIVQNDIREHILGPVAPVAV